MKCYILKIDMFLCNSVSGDDFMLLSTELKGDNWSSKSDAASSFACLDDTHSFDLTISDDHEEEESTDNEISEPEDNDWKIFPLSLAAADDVCIKLDKLIQTGIVSKTKLCTNTLKTRLKF